MEEQMNQVLKLILLKNRDEYLIGSVTELDEEPSLLIEKCFKVIECAEYGDNPENLEKRAYSLEPIHSLTSARKIDEGATDKDWYVYEYVILQAYPKYSSQRDLFLTSDSVFTIIDPDQSMLDLYQKTIK